MKKSLSGLVEQFVRFVGIGFINTALSFAILNTFMAATGLFKGTAVGVFSVIAFCLAVLHSYFWNKNWAFSSVSTGGEGFAGFFKRVWQSIFAGALGLVIFVAVVYGSNKEYGYAFYLLMIIVLGIGELLMWNMFRLGKNLEEALAHKNQDFVNFLIISAIGALINYAILKYGTTLIPPKFGLGAQLWANVIQIFATGISLVWNFVGYKIFVFKQKA